MKTATWGNMVYDQQQKKTRYDCKEHIDGPQIEHYNGCYNAMAHYDTKRIGYENPDYDGVYHKHRYALLGVAYSYKDTKGMEEKYNRRYQGVLNMNPEGAHGLGLEMENDPRKQSKNYSDDISDHDILSVDRALVGQYGQSLMGDMLNDDDGDGDGAKNLPDSMQEGLEMAKGTDEFQSFDNNTNVVGLATSVISAAIAAGAGSFSLGNVVGLLSLLNAGSKAVEPDETCDLNPLTYEYKSPFGDADCMALQYLNFSVTLPESTENSIRIEQDFDFVDESSGDCMVMYHPVHDEINPYMSTTLDLPVIDKEMSGNIAMDVGKTGEVSQTSSCVADRSERPSSCNLGYI